MFGIIKGVIDLTTETISDVIDVGTAVVTLGEYGDLNKQNVSRLVASGMTLYALSEATGVAIELLEKALED